MILDELVLELQSKLLHNPSLEVLCYYFIHEMKNEIIQLDKSQFIGEIEHIATLSFCEEYADRHELESINKKLENSTYKKGLKIYHFLGLSLQDDFNNTSIFEKYLNERFNTQSIRYKYLISKVFRKFEDHLKKILQTQIETQDKFILVLKYIYLEFDINKNKVIFDFEKDFETLDIIDLMLLEDFQHIKSIGYDRMQDRLLEDVLWCAREIQSKHKQRNNKEDQYNSFFQSFLLAKGYNADDQTQRGESSSQKQPGELDVMVFTKEGIPLSILEAFKLESVENKTITDHLKKLSENYDPNGLRNNYVIIYAESSDFSDLWRRYKDFVPTINYTYELEHQQIEDVTDKHQQVAGIKLGLAKHRNRGIIVHVYHIFMDMNF